MDDIYNLDADPSEKEVNKVFMEISKKLKDGKENEVNYLVIYLFAGHGILRDGMQSVLLNEYSKRDKFYKMFKAEAAIRLQGTHYPNSYIIGIFACCRQLYNQKAMTGMISKEEAIERLQKS